MPVSGTKIHLLYLHRHRQNDLLNFLKSLERVTELDITLIVSDNTVDHVDILNQTSHHFLAIHNLDQGQPQSSSVSSCLPVLLVFQEIKRCYYNFKNRYEEACRLLSGKSNTVLVAYDDRMEGVLSVLKASHTCGVPVFIPAMLTTKPDLNATTSNTLKPKRKIESFVVWCVKKIFPSHINRKGRLFYDPVGYLILLLFRSVPKNPWVKGTLEYTTKIGVESKIAYRSLLKAGADESKLALTGMPVYDLMDFSTERGKSVETLLCALPQYGEHGAMTQEMAMPIIEDILLGFKEFSGEVIVSLHPRMDSEVYRPLIEKFGYHCVLGGVDALLKKATLFFAASSSTTVYSSLLMGVPTVLFNHIPPGSNIFKDLKSLVYIEEAPLVEIPAIFQKKKMQWQSLIETDQKLLSSELVKDGCCGERNFQLIQQL